MSAKFVMPIDLVDVGLPRRLSARKGDTHYDDRAASFSDRIDIILDGQILEHATAWDVDIGMVTFHQRDANGIMVLHNGAPTFETRYGRVEVRWNREVKP